MRRVGQLILLFWKSTKPTKGKTMITVPGRFEGCHEYAPYFWEQCLDGLSDEDINVAGRVMSFFRLRSEDKTAFPDLSPYNFVAVWEDDNGFVYCLPAHEIPKETISCDA